MSPFRPRAERTRAEILAAAEAVFAESGFAAAKLQDVAQRVGIKRASLVYYFRCKQELYDAVLDGMFGELATRYRAILNTPAPLTERVERVIDAWVSYATERQALAPIVLREAARALPAQRAVLVQHSRAAIAATVQAIEEGQRQGVFRPIDPIHFLFAVVGATVFFLSGTSTLVPDWPFDPFSREQTDALRGRVIEITRQLLGVPPRAAVQDRRSTPRRKPRPPSHTPRLGTHA